VHGDAASLAGWGFAHDRLDDPAHARWIESAFQMAQVDVFASTHTCLPAFRLFKPPSRSGRRGEQRRGGNAEFRGDRVRPGHAHREDASRHRLFGLQANGVHVEALPLNFDRARWIERFRSAWPAGSAAHASYYRRITSGPRFSLSQATP
jgi:hypothetical protein